MTIEKALWSADGENIRMSMPLTKVDIERRIVSGFATLDNVDRQNDIVSTEASVKAFSRFKGNIREMHQPIAVGKLVSFKQDRYFDADTKKFYSGVFVSAYVSKGAQDTWEKVLDGTYTGFSIGGVMKEWDDAFDENAESPIRVIKDYDLYELSLVDSPANQFASIVSIEKVNGVDVLKGEVTETVLENVFWDEQSGLVLLSEEDAVISPASDMPMKNIGFVEKSDSAKADMIKFLVDDAKGITASKINKEVSLMTENDVAETAIEKSEVAPEAETVAEDVVAEVAAEEVVESEVVEEETIEKSVDESPVEDTVAPVEEIAKSVSEEATEIKDAITSAFSDLTEIVKSLHEQISEMQKSIGVTNEAVAAVKSEVDSTKQEFGKSMDKVIKDTAFRKSGDLGEVVQEQPELVEKSLWGGRFLKTADLFK
jgi:hypothetical protein